MKITYIANLPTSIIEIPEGCLGVHESTLRAFQILEKVKYYLEKDISKEMILELIKEMENEDYNTT
jgi:hypothetical protein